VRAYVTAASALVAVWTLAARLPGSARADDRPPSEERASAEADRHDGDEGDDEPSDEAVDVTVRAKPPPRSPSRSERERDVLRAAPHRGGSDLLRTVPGVFVGQHGGEGKAHQLFFRGFDARHGQDLELVVGGIPVNEPSNIHGQGYADVHFVIPEAVSGIEALPGAFDPEQGDFAVAGTVRYHLGLAEPGVHATASYGDFATRRLFLGYRPRDAPEATFAAFELYESDGFGVGRAAERASLMGQSLVPLGSEVALRVLVTSYSGRFGSSGVLLEREVDAGIVDRFSSYDVGQGGESHRSQLLGEIVWDGDDHQLRVAPWVGYRTLTLTSNFTGYLEDPLLGDAVVQTNDVAAIGMSGTFTKHLAILSAHDSLGGGLSFRNDWIEQRQVPRDGARPASVDAGVRATAIGGWLDAALRPVSRVVLRAAVRVDGLIDGVEDRLTGESRGAAGINASPRATVDVAIVPELHALASYGHGFRSPQARSLVDGEPLPFTRSYGGELGLRYHDPRFLASLAGFCTGVSDDLVFNEASAQNEAVPGTLRGGVALDLEARPHPWFVAALGASYTHAVFREASERFAEGDLLPYVPQLVGRSDMAFVPVFGRFVGRELSGRLGSGMSLAFNRPLPFAEVGDDVFLVDALVGMRFGEIELGLGVENLFDVPWYESELVYASSFRRPPAPQQPSRIPQRHVAAGAPRRILGSLSVHY
jgi:outer membrane receptor protein involved in Fe transport